MSRWIGVDLDGTLAVYDGWRGEAHIGDPIPAMANRVRQWIMEGQDVRIFTARVDGGEVAISMGNANGEKFRDVALIRGIIQDWTEKHFGVRLPVTNKKDYGMVELWDDRAVQVIPNTGERADSIKRECQTCRWWSKEPMRTNPPTNEQLCHRSKFMHFQAYGQDGKAIITGSDFGCNSWEAAQ